MRVKGDDLEEVAVRAGRPDWSGAPRPSGCREPLGDEPAVGELKDRHDVAASRGQQAWDVHEPKITGGGRPVGREGAAVDGCQVQGVVQVEPKGDKAVVPQNGHRSENLAGQNPVDLEAVAERP